VDVVMHPQALRAMPAGAIQQEYDLLAVTRTAVAKAASSASKRGTLTDVAR
jgi:hypothetical protein